MGKTGCASSLGTALLSVVPQISSGVISEKRHLLQSQPVVTARTIKKLTKTLKEQEKRESEIDEN